MTPTADRLDVAALRADLAAAEAEWLRLDRQADRSAAVRSAPLVERIQHLRATIARAEQKSKGVNRHEPSALA